MDGVYASPSLRTIETVGEVRRGIDSEPIPESGLGEQQNRDRFDGEPETIPQERLADRFGAIRLGHEPFLRS
ncbi:hypothetical protein [Halorubrum ejinorense]|uniref:hypothetical protein n=1 Tax=Halorubrum ejinorense TaxID=425309 RepID=UPI00360AFCAB